MFWLTVLLYILGAVVGGAIFYGLGTWYCSRIEADIGWGIIFPAAAILVFGVPFGAILGVSLVFVTLQFGVVGLGKYCAVLVLLCAIGWLFYAVPKALKEAESQRYEAQFAQTEQDMRQLLDAARAGDLATVTTLINAGMFVDTYYTHDPNYGETALMLAARNGHTEMVDFLLSRGANPDVQNDRGKTAETLAQESGHGDIAALIAEASRQRRLTG